MVGNGETTANEAIRINFDHVNFFVCLQGDTDEELPSGGFHMGAVERRANVLGPGFSLKF